MTDPHPSEPSQPILSPAQPPYTPPSLERIGIWQAVTLAVSAPVGPGSIGQLFEPLHYGSDH